MFGRWHHKDGDDNDDDDDDGDDDGDGDDDDDVDDDDDDADADADDDDDVWFVYDRFASWPEVTEFRMFGRWQVTFLSSFAKYHW